MTSVLFPVLGTSQLTDIVSNKVDIFARWERMRGTHQRYEVSKPGGDDHGKQYNKHKDRYQRVNTEGVEFSVVRSVKVRGKGRAGRTARPLGSVEEMEATVAGFSPWECPIRRGRW